VRSIVVDAGPLIALFRKRDKHHRRVKQFLSTATGRLVSTLPVITEVCHFLNARGKLAFLAWIRLGGLSLQRITPDDLQEIAAIIERYADRHIDFADATLVWLAELLNTIDVMTIDRADFRVFRSRRGQAFNLVLS
jgi:predicted nucleic acid-binding protein